MMNRTRHLWLKMNQILASTALLLAVYSVSATCMFMIYQPDVPKELL